MIPITPMSSVKSCWINCGPRSVTISSGTPVKGRMCTKNNWDISLAVTLLVVGIAQANLEKESITVNNMLYVLLPIFASGNGPTRSKCSLEKGVVAGSRACTSPAMRRGDPLLRIQVRHLCV